MTDEHVEAASRMQTYIENHLKSVITLKNLADEAGYSPFYAAKVFKSITGLSPFDYIRRRRLTVAAMFLRDEKAKILDVALDFVFDSHEGFTRAFSKCFGVTPSLYHQQKRPLRWFLPHDVMDHHNYLKRKGVETMKQPIQTIFTQIIERPARKAIIMRGVKAEDYFAYCEEVDCDIWGVLLSVKEALYEPVGMWLPDKLIKQSTSRYVQGVEVPINYEGMVPEGCELIDLEPMTYMVFQGEPYDDAVFEIKVGEIMNAIKQYNPTLYGYDFAYQNAPRCQLEPQGYRGYIEMHPVKKR